MDRDTVVSRAHELLGALGLAGDASALVVDYSAGMTKKISLACALVHAPRVLVLDEPFEAVDPVSASTIKEILDAFVDSGGTVVLSSHVMELVERLCSDVAVIAAGQVRAVGTVDEVRGGRSLEERFVDLVGGRTHVQGLEWLRTFSD
jgi:ABC-2 type transport system ATP-binding protein